MRKTIEVETIRQMANTYAESPITTPDERLAVFGMASAILSATGNYKGFKYAEQTWNDETGSMDIGDESRRILY